MLHKLAGPLALVAAVAAPCAILSPPVSAQTRDLTRAPADGKVFTGRLDADGTPASFTISLPERQAYEVEVLSLTGFSPVIEVYSETGDQPVATAEGLFGESVGVRLYRPTAQTMRITVRNAASDDLAGEHRFALMLLPSDYQPKPVVPITLGSLFPGRLDRQDEQWFTFTGEAGQAWEFALSRPDGSALDPVLALFQGETAEGEPLAQDDDSGGDMGALLQFVVPQPGTYTLRATGYGESEGPFNLAARALGAGVPPAIPALAGTIAALGQPTKGTLTGQTAYLRLDPALIAQLRGAPGPLIVEMVKGPESTLDPLVEVGFETPLGILVADSDDDSAGDLNARLLLPLPPDIGDGDWLDRMRIGATAFGDAAGDYQVVICLPEPGQVQQCASS